MFDRPPPGCARLLRSPAASRCIALLALLAVPVSAQVDVQLILPAASNMPSRLDEWESNPAIVQVILTNTTNDDLFDLRLDATLTGTQRGEIARTQVTNPAHPRFDLGFGEARPFLWDEVVSDAALTVASGIEDEMARDGIPEDIYRLCVRVLDDAGANVTLGGERCQTLTILQPDPPTLVSPADGQEIDPAALQFAWTPVQVPAGLVAYRLVVRPLFVGQDPAGAMAGNPEVLDVEVPTTSYLYLPSDEPLDDVPGAVGFVWQVQSLLDGDPIGRGEGLSRLRTFAVAPSADADPFPDDPPAEPVVWSFPAGDPILRADLTGTDQAEAPDGLLVDGAGQADLGDLSMRLAFVGSDGARLDLDAGTVLDGFVRFERLFSLNAQYEEGCVTDCLLTDWRAVETGDLTGGIDGVTFSVGRRPRITPAGLVNDGPSGNTTDPNVVGYLRLPGIVDATYDLVFTRDFALGGEPFGVVSGAVTFLNRADAFEPGEPFARLTPSGFSVLGRQQAGPPPADDTPTPVIWAFPAESPVLAARILTPDSTAAGTRLPDGAIDAAIGANIRADVRFVDDSETLAARLAGATVDLGTGAVVAGRVELPDGARLQGATLGGEVVAWRFAPDDALMGPIGTTGAFGIDLPAGSAITEAGITLTGPAPGRIRLDGVEEPLCRAEPTSPLTVGVDASGGLAVLSGSALFVCAELPTAILDETGLRAVVPDGTGPAEGSVAWGYPAARPLVTLDLPTPLPVPSTIQASGEFEGRVGTMEVRADARGAIFDVQTGTVPAGRVVINGAFAAMARVGPDGLYGWQIVEAGTTVGDADNVVVFDLGYGIVVEGEQMRADGPSIGFDEAETRGEIAVGAMPPGPYTVTFSNNFAWGGSPLGVVSGAVVFSYQGEMVATVDPDGLTIINPEPGVRPPDPVAWGFPLNAPIVQFSIDEYIRSEGLPLVDGSFRGTGPDGEVSALFQDALLNPRDAGLYIGQVILQDGFSIVAPIDGGRDMTWRAVTADAELPDGHVRLALQTPLRVNLGGLRATRALARVDSPEMPPRELTATFSQDFAFATNPALQIASGQIELRLGSTLLATIDPSGFRFEGAVSPVAAALPERLPLPSAGLASLVLSDAGTLTVDAVAQPDGSILLSPAGAAVELELAMVDGAPRLPVTIRGLRLDGETYAVLGGTVEATIPAGDDRFSPEAFGLPLAVSQLTAGFIDGAPGLALDGRLVLFGETITAGAPVRAVGRGDGTLRTDVALTSLPSTYDLAGDGRVALDVRGVSGTIVRTASAPAAATLDVDGRFVVRDGSMTVASAALGLQVRGASVSVARFEPDDAQRGRIDLGGLGLAVERISTLRSFGFDPVDGFSFAAPIDLRLALALDGSELQIPLDGAELGSDGFDVPAQNRSVPDARAQDYGPVAVQVLHFVMDRTTFDWPAWQPGQPHPFAPTLQLAVSPAGFPQTELGSISATVNDATLDGGSLVGALLPWTAPGSGKAVPFSASSQLLVRGMGGALTASGAEITLSGVVDLGADREPGCSEPTVTVRLTGAGRFEGEAPDFAPCGSLRPNALPLDLAFQPGSQLAVAYGPDAQRLTVDGTAEARLLGAGFTEATGTGSVRVDLASGVVESADLALGSLGWSYPSAAPLFSFSVPNGRLTPDGLALSGRGTLATPGGTSETVGAQFSDVTVALDDGQITRGGVVIDGAFALELATAPVAWSVSGRTALPADARDRVLMTLPRGIRLGADGLSPTVEESGAVRVGDVVRDGLAVRYLDGFVLGVAPTGVTAGRAEWADGPDVVATLSPSGLRIGGQVAAATLPATLPLPTAATAVLRLTDDTGAPLVEVGAPNANGLRPLTTLPGRRAVLALTGLAGDASAPEVEVELSAEAGILVDDAFAVQAGTIGTTLPAGAELDLSDQGTPILLTRVEFEGGQLRTSGRLALPGPLASETVALGDGLALRITESGLMPAEGTTVTVGTLEEVYTGGQDGEELVSAPLLGSSLELSISGAEVTFGDAPRFRFSGGLTSSLLSVVDTTATSGAPAGSPTPAAGGPAAAPEADPGRLHALATYGASGWTFDVTAALAEDQALGLGGMGVLTLHEGDLLRLDISDAQTALTLKGPTLSIPRLMGAEFAVTVDSLRIAEQVYIAASTESLQETTLFGGFLTLTPDRVGITYDGTSGVFYTELSGSMSTKLQQAVRRTCGGAPAAGAAASGQAGCPREPTPESFAFEQMRIGTDGSFSIGRGELDLLSDSITVIRDRLWFDELVIGFGEDDPGLQLTLGGQIKFPTPEPSSGRGLTTTRPGANAPRPVAPTAEVRFTIDSGGRQSGGEVTYAFDNNPTTPTIGDNPSTEWAMGDRAVFELTGLAADISLDAPETTAIYLTGGIHLRPRDRLRNERGQRVQGPARDPRGRTRYIAFGSAANIREDPGLTYTVADGLLLSVETEGTAQDPLFTFAAGPFDIDLTSVKVEVGAGGSEKALSGMEVTLGGRAALTTDKIEGHFSYSGLTLGTSGITDWGGPDGGAKLSIPNVMTLEVGCFEYQSAGDTPYALQVGAGDNTETVQVDEYLRFAGECAAGTTGATMPPGAGPTVPAALTVELAAGGFSGSVGQVLYYTSGSSTTLSVQDVHIDLVGKGANAIASLDASLDATFGGDSFEVSVMGVGKVGTLGLAATGYIATGSVTRFGIFLAADGVKVPLFPPVPTAIQLTGVGGGFFYKPTAADVDRVYDTLDALNADSGGFQANNPNGVPSADGAEFAVLLYAGIGLVQTGPGYVLDAKGLIVVTDQFMNLDLNGVLLSQPENLTGGAYLTVQYADPENISVEGGIRVDVDYAGALTGGASIDFTYSKTAWSIYGRVGMSVVSLIDFNGEFVASPVGFAATLSSELTYDIVIASATASFQAEFWYESATGDFGAYGTTSADVSVLGVSIAAVRFTGALIKQTRASQDYWLLYCSAAVETFLGDIAVWLALENGDVDGGFGSDERYERMVNSARQTAANMLQQAQQAKTEAQQAAAAVSAIQEEARRAAERLRQTAAAEEAALAVAREEEPLYRSLGSQLYADSYPSLPDWWRSASDVVRWVSAQNYMGLLPDDNTDQYRSFWASVDRNWQSRPWLTPRGLNGTRRGFGGRPPVGFEALQRALDRNAAEMRAAVDTLESIIRVAEAYVAQADRLLAGLPSEQERQRMHGTVGSPLALQVSATDPADRTFAFQSEAAASLVVSRTDSRSRTEPSVVREQYASAVRDIAQMHERIRTSLYHLQTSAFRESMEQINRYFEPRIGVVSAQRSFLADRRDAAQRQRGAFDQMVADDYADYYAAPLPVQDGRTEEQQRSVRVWGAIGTYRNRFFQTHFNAARIAPIIQRGTAALRPEGIAYPPPEPAFRTMMTSIHYDIHMFGMEAALEEFDTYVGTTKQQLTEYQQSLYDDFQPYTSTVDRLFGQQVRLAQSVTRAAGLYREWLLGSELPGIDESTVAAEINMELPVRTYARHGYGRYAAELEPLTPAVRVISQDAAGTEVYGAYLLVTAPEGGLDFLHPNIAGRPYSEVRAAFEGQPVISMGTASQLTQLFPDASPALDEGTPPRVCGRAQMRSVGGVLSAPVEACVQLEDDRGVFTNDSFYSRPPNGR